MVFGFNFLFFCYCLWLFVVVWLGVFVLIFLSFFTTIGVALLSKLSSNAFNRQLNQLNKLNQLTKISSIRSFSTETEKAKEISINFVLANGETISCPAKIGDTLLDVCFNNELDVEGACGGECCCSTCHVYLTKDVYDRMPEPDEDELDMLDLAIDVEDTYVVFFIYFLFALYLVRVDTYFLLILDIFRVFAIQILFILHAGSEPFVF